MVFFTAETTETAEIIWYDFKHQAMDLINDVNIWEIQKISKEQLIQTITFWQDSQNRW